MTLVCPSCKGKGLRYDYIGDPVTCVVCGGPGRVDQKHFDNFFEEYQDLDLQLTHAWNTAELHQLSIAIDALLDWDEYPKNVWRKANVGKIWYDEEYHWFYWRPVGNFAWKLRDIPLWDGNDPKPSEIPRPEWYWIRRGLEDRGFPLERGESMNNRFEALLEVAMRRATWATHYPIEVMAKSYLEDLTKKQMKKG